LASHSQSRFDSSSLEIVPSARHAARLERFAIQWRRAIDQWRRAIDFNRNDSLARVCEKHTIGTVSRPVSLLDHCKDRGFASSQNSSMHAGILSFAGKCC
jgi:hypothetical protein